MTSRKFYNLKLNTEATVAGTYPQVNSIRIDYHKARTSQFGEILEWEGREDLPELGHFQLDRSAKLTDILSSAYSIMLTGFLISHRGGALLSEKNIAHGSFEAATVYQGDTPYRYYFLWYKAGDDYIDFKKSDFYRYHSVRKTFADKVDVKTKEAFKEQNLELLMTTDFNTLQPKRIYLNQPMDLVSLLTINGDIICSEDLKQDVEKERLTGLIFEPLEYDVICEG